MTRWFCLACLLNFAEQASWAEPVRRGNLSDQKIEKGTFIRVEKLSFYESAVKIHDIVGISNVLHCTHKLFFFVFSYSYFASKLIKIQTNKAGLGFGRLQTIGAINPIFYLKR